MYMSYSAIDYCVGTVQRFIVKTKNICDWQEFHILDEHTPSTGIIMSAATTVRMYLTRLEHHGWIAADVLELLLTGKTIGL